MYQECTHCRNAHMPFRTTVALPCLAPDVVPDAEVYAAPFSSDSIGSYAY